VNDVIIVLLVILVIVVIVRGPKTIPQIGRMFGQGVREAREEINKVRKDEEPDDAAANTTAGGGTTSP
jgi:Sec-independent protein translocase protein TatA